MLYYLVYIPAYLLSLLPFRLLYMISDVLRWILFRIIGYRKEIVLRNLTASFPDQPVHEIQAIKKAFEQSFCDQWVEMIKLLTMSSSSLQSRVKCDWSLLHQYEAEGISCNILLGHLFNWEWGNAACAMNVSQIFAGVYLPQKPKAVNQLVYRIRSRMGSVLIDATNMRGGQEKLKGKVHIQGLIADQTPGNMKVVRWYKFLNRPCPFMSGPEKASRRKGTAVVYCATEKIRRGYYRITLEEITRNASLEAEGYITDVFVQKLQEQIKRQPANWLWTHRRWKRTLPEGTVVFPVPEKGPAGS